METNEGGVVFSFNVAKDNPTMIDSKKKSESPNGSLIFAIYQRRDSKSTDFSDSFYL